MKRLLIVAVLMFSLPELQARQRLTLEECRRLALEQSEEMRIARYRVEKAEAERAAMKTQYFPSLSGSATGVYLFKDIEQELTLPTQVPDPATGQLKPNVMVNPATGEVVTGPDGNPVFNMVAWLPLEISLKGAYLAGITVQQPLYTGGKIAAGNAMTRIGVEMAGDQMQAQKAALLYETDQAYWLFVTVQEKVKLAKAYKELLSKLQKRVEDACETGMTTRNELLKVVVKHNNAKLQLQKAESGLELTRLSLCRLTGLPFDTAIETADTSLVIGNLFVAPDETASVSDRPEYRLLKKNAELAGEKVKLARADFLPTAGISAGYDYVGGISVGTEDFNSSSPSVIASVKIPLFHWGEGRQKQLSAMKDQEIRKADLEKNATLMKLEMEQARLNLKDAMLRAELAGEALSQAEENLRVAGDYYELGMGLLTDLLEAQTQWQGAQSENIEAKADLKLKETAWLKASGKL